MRHRLIFSGILVAAIGGWACGDDEVPPQQAVFWLGLGTTATAQCSANRVFQLPEDARTTITSSSGKGERVKDGQDLQGTDARVECTVRETSRGSGSYNVSMRFSVGEIGNFIADGVLPASTGTLDVDFNTNQFELGQEGCSATVEVITAGAVWVKDLHCDNMRDPSSPSVACDARGGVIFENCAR
ncbi:MAG TPA: hypothetical protein VJU61_20890 [Polyangiaceae bacterium]|nr:hypothetical protein [Polyangiaceae bacterium]